MRSQPTFPAPGVTRGVLAMAAAAILLAAKTEVAAGQSGVVFASPTLLDRVTSDASLKPLLAQASPQSLSAVLPEIEDTVRAFDARQNLTAKNTLRRLAREQGVYIYLWTGEEQDLVRKMAEASKYVRERPIAAEVAVFLFAGGGADSALLFSDAIVTRRGLPALKAVAEAVPNREGVAAGFGEAILAFLGTFEQHTTSRGVDAAVLPVRADELHTTPAAAQGSPEPVGAESATGIGPVEFVGMPSGELAGAAVKAERPAAPDPQLWKPPSAASAADGVQESQVVELPQSDVAEAVPASGEGAVSFKLDRAGKLFIGSILLVLLPVFWMGIARVMGWLRQRTREVPQRADMGRIGEPLLNAARNRPTELPGPRMHPIEQKVQLSPRRPFRGPGSQK